MNITCVLRTTLVVQLVFFRGNAHLKLVTYVQLFQV